MDPVRPLVDLAEQILAAANTIHNHLVENNIPQPSFGVEAPPIFPPQSAPLEVTAAHIAIKNATKTLHDLVRGPYASLLWLNGNYVDCMSLQYITRFNVAEAVPLEGEVSFAEVAATAGVEESQAKRMLRLAMTHNIFSEPHPGFVAHTAQSALLVRNKPIRKLCEYAMEDSFPAAAKVCDAISKWGASEEPNHGGFQLAHDTPLPTFAYWAQHPERMARFAEAMTCLTADEGYDIGHTVAGFDWKGLGNGLVVDVGGSKGQAAMAIAREAPNLRFVVQDLPQSVVEGAAELPTEMKDRISFHAHDFFTSQPIKDADAYLLRFVLHDWSDTYAAKILQNIIPSMKPGARILITESVMPPPGVIPKSDERIIRFMDLQMMLLLNAKEREMGDWETLFAKTDGRLKLKNVVQPRGSVMSVMELVLED